MIGNRSWPAKLSSTLTLSYFATFKLRPLAECPWIRKQMFKGQSPQRLVPWPGPHQLLSRTQCFNINIQHRRREAESWNLPTRYTLHILVASVASFITAHQLPGSRPMPRIPWVLSAQSTSLVLSDWPRPRLATWWDPAQPGLESRHRQILSRAGYLQAKVLIRGNREDGQPKAVSPLTSSLRFCHNPPCFVSQEHYRTAERGAGVTGVIQG